MALNLGQLLGGAGIVATRQRQAKEAERVAQQNQLALEQLNRQNRLRQEMLQAPTPVQQVPGLQIPEALAERPVVQAPVIPTAPAAVPVTPEGIGTVTVTKPPALPLNTVGAQEALRNIPTMQLTRSQWQSLSPEEKNRRFQEFRGKGERGLPGLPRPGAPKNLAELEASLRQDVRRNAPRAKGKTVSSADALINRVIQREGGYVNDPDDMGGETNFGISKNAYPDLDIANLTKEQAAAIYKRDYWDALGIDKLPVNMREIAFDAAVNQGPGFTKAALQRAGNDPQKFLELRAARYQQIVDANPSQAKFLDGWLNRLRDVASGAVSAVIPTAQAEPAPTPAAAPAPTAGVDTNLSQRGQMYLANPEAIPFEMQRALQQRQELAQLAGMYQRAGMGQEFMQTRAQVLELDNNMFYLQGMQGIQEFGLANDPRRLSAVWSAYSGMQIGVQPRSDGRFDVLVSGQRAREGLDRNELVNMARLSFDTNYRQAQAQAGAEANMETFKAQLDVQKDQAKQTAQMIREIAVAQTQGNLAQALEWAKANYKWDITATGAGDGTIIIKPPGAAPYLFNPSGRTVEIDGVKVQSMAAYPIAGLPSYGGLSTR